MCISSPRKVTYIKLYILIVIVNTISNLHLSSNHASPNCEQDSIDYCVEYVDQLIAILKNVLC